jgi:hypothetical protein
MDRAKGMLAGLAGSLKRLSIGGALAGGAAAMASMYASARGIRSALDMGGRLSDIAANTGLAAGEALVMERALRDAGISGEKLQPTIQKMQRSIVEAGEGVATYRRAFEALGLSLADLRRMSPAEQFTEIQRALAGIEDPAERSARAMQIFGRSGGELGALLSNADAMTNAAASVGGQAEILNRSADSFDRASDLLGGMGDKLRGLFVGMADFINPVLLPVLEKFNSVDWSGIGQQVGRAVAMLVEAFKQDAVPGLLRDGLLLAAKEFVNYLVKGIRGVIASLIEYIKNIPEIIVSGLRILFEKDFWSGLRSIMSGLGGAIAQAFMQILPSAVAESFGISERLKKEHGMLVKAEFSAGAAAMMRASEGYRESLSNAVVSTAGAFKEEMSKNGPLDVSAERGRLSKTLEKIGRAVDEQRESVNQGAKEEQGKAGAGDLALGDSEGIMGRVVRPMVSSLARVGGAAITGMGGLSLDRERNRTLKTIERNTRDGGGSPIAVYG